MLTTFIMLFFIIPIQYVGLMKAVITFLTFSTTLSVVSALSFVTNHTVDCTMFNDADKQKDIAKSQIEGSHNVCIGDTRASYAINVLTGGLSHQIEHHLFPSYHFLLYPTLSSLVKKHGVPPYFNWMDMWYL